MQQDYATIEYLGQKQFSITLLITFIAHLLLIYGWHLLPNTKILDIPVRALNIRLGDGDIDLQEQQQADEATPQPISTNNAQLEAEMSKLIRKPEPEKKLISKKITAKSADAFPPVESPKIGKAIPQQFVRENTAKAPDKISGSVLGNSTADDAEVESNYKQTVSLWVKKFKQQTFYPKDAMVKPIVTIRIRIDRRGNIRYSDIYQQSEYEELNQSALNMVRRANPVPAMPDNYPQGEMFEFLIPVIFELE